MLKRMLTALVLLSCQLQPAFADEGTEVSHTLSFPQKNNQYLHVNSKFAVASDQVDLSLPSWSPGSYLIRVPASLLRNAARVLDVVNLSPIVPEHYILADTNFVLDISAARDELGWSPRYDNIQMMCDAYDAYVAAGEAARPAPHPVLKLLDAVVPHRL